MFALIAACGGGNEPADGDGLTIATVTRTAGDTNAAVPVSTPTPDSPELSGFIYPIEGGCLPQGNQLMPNAPREYRNGTHEGVDFYNVDNCTPIGPGTPAVAVKAGRIIRIDHDYVDPTIAEMDALLANPANEEALDQFRGRQVWIDHGGGLVTRYCHLDSVADGLQVNDEVAQGTTIGLVGNSGTPESVYSGGGEYHLHWEVRVGDSYFGAGQDAASVRGLYLALFEP